MLQSAEKLRAFVTECLDRYPIDPNRLAVLGFSQGGVMAYSLALTEPARFKALTVLSSWLPKDLQNRLTISPAICELPSLVQHGTQDPTIEVTRARDSVARLKSINLPLEFREYEMGHEIRPRSLADLSTWLDNKIGAPA